MKQSVESLLKLQEIDAQLFQLNQEEKCPSEEHITKQGELAHAQKAYRISDRAFREVERDRRGLELKILTLREDIKKAESKRRDVRNTKEEFAANKELENFQKKLSEATKAIEEKTLAADKKAVVRDERQKAMDDFQEQYNGLEESRKVRMAELKTERQRLIAQRDDYISRVDETVFALYERVQKIRKGSGVAILSGNVCGSCHVSIPPATRYQVEKMQEIITCPSCSRILYPEEELHEQPKAS